MKIITISDSPTMFSGLARVHRHVVNALLEAGHQVLPCGWHCLDDDQIADLKANKRIPPVMFKSSMGDLPVLNVHKGNGNKDMFDVYDAVRFVKPDAVVTIGDHWNFWYMRQIKIKSGFSFAWIPYLTVEADEIEPKWASVLRYADAIAVPSLFGKEVVESYVQKEAHFIPYGTEQDFKRMRARNRRSLRKQNGCDDKVRFITVAQNTHRKNLPALIQAVSLIAHRDPKRHMQFHLYTNLDPDDREEYLYDLRTIVSRFGVEDRFVFSEDDEETFSLFEAPSDAYMNKQYAMADFFVLPSTCEGYGLPLVESMACGVVPIANASSTIPEHLGAPKGQSFGRAARGFLVSNRTEVHPPARMVKIVRQDALGQAIWEAYQMTRDPEGLRILASMRDLCEEYGKGRDWESMKIELCNVVEAVAGKPRVAVEEL